MFTTWCTLYAKLVPAVRPGIPLFRDYVKAKNSTMVESASKAESHQLAGGDLVPRAGVVVVVVVVGNTNTSESWSFPGVP